MRDDDWQRVGILRPNMDKMNVEPVDIRYEMRQRFQLRLALTPVVVLHPIIREFLHRGQLHTLRIIGDRFLFGPARWHDALAKIIERGLRRSRDSERPDRG